MAHRTRKAAPARSPRNATARRSTRGTESVGSDRKGGAQAAPAGPRRRLASLRWLGAPARFGIGLSLAATTLVYVALRERMRG